MNEMNELRNKVTVTIKFSNQVYKTQENRGQQPCFLHVWERGHFF